MKTTRSRQQVEPGFVCLHLLNSFHPVVLEVMAVKCTIFWHVTPFGSSETLLAAFFYIATCFAQNYILRLRLFLPKRRWTSDQLLCVLSRKTLFLLEKPTVAKLLTNFRISIITQFSHLHLVIASGMFLSGFPTQTICGYMFSYTWYIPCLSLSP